MGCVPSIIRRTDECVGTDESYDEITYLKVQHYHTSPKTSKYMSNASVITSNIQRGNSKSESTLPKTNTSAEIIAGPVISSIKEKNRFKEFDLDYLENKPYLPLYQNFNHENIQGKSNRDIPRLHYSSSSSS